ncbi:Replicase polyprotein 1a [Frankliniella fusca]|uniref:Replicase polyprotein 1a n=1 Tax=Frankliniella fusca TaxID=407009 RepID=A0AAE1HV73_9NEOP|nr:Replicase polyprotein 1a [Frankliniella fusca]
MAHTIVDGSLKAALALPKTGAKHTRSTSPSLNSSSDDEPLAVKRSRLVVSAKTNVPTAGKDDKDDVVTKEGAKDLVDDDEDDDDDDDDEDDAAADDVSSDAGGAGGSSQVRREARHYETDEEAVDLRIREDVSEELQ